jgi:hypothetical protein
MKSYKKLTDLLEIAEQLNFTGGIDANGKPIPNGYKVDFYKDLAFVALLQEDNESIDNAIYLQQNKKGRYEIYEIDGKLLGKIQNGSLLLIQLYLISAMISKEEFEK